MAAPRKFDLAERERAVGMFRDRLRDHGESKLAARKHVGELLNINPPTLRNWIEAEEKRDMRPSGSDDESTIDPAEFHRLQKENAELRRGQRDLEDSFGVFAQAELDRKLK